MANIVLGSDCNKVGSLRLVTVVHSTDKRRLEGFRYLLGLFLEEKVALLETNKHTSPSGQALPTRGPFHGLRILGASQA